MSVGVIYVLTSESFPEYVKIGYADNLENRVAELNRSEALPFPFEVYCYLEVTSRLTDLKVHELIDTLNPTLRARSTVDGRVRVREFFKIAPEKAYEMLKAIAIISGHPDRLHWRNEVIVIPPSPPNQPLTEGENKLLHIATPETRDLYLAFRNKILALEGVTVKPLKFWVSFKIGKNAVCDINVQKNCFKLYINLKIEEVQNPPATLRDISHIGHYGSGDYQLTVQNQNGFSYAMSLVEQSYNKNRQ